ncbi:3-isopropylmalate dehydratase [Natribacillus halophilus]|uniref:PH domain-containing protein n=1 Tax=Natribacillus halophilus TaxID=549003 RepID=A0A1G8NZ82_9BACI|nr:3-isopropylmalate dehydratase [Natribacillus halophilus]SDI85553.1 hypothetical protein SAMN04488123_107113 [Natribacillus halophilus]
MDEQPIAVHPIAHMEQKIGAIEKHTEHYHTEMKLYRDRIDIDDDRYPIDKVFDISYRYKENEVGFLYLHTSQGVRSYFITADPEPFIAAFREVEQK